MPDGASTAALAAASSIAASIGAHALAAYATGLIVVMVATTIGWRLHARRAAGRRSRAGDASFALRHLRVVLVVILVASSIFLLSTIDTGDADPIGRFDTTLAATLSRSLAPDTLATFAAITHLADERTLIALAIGVALALVATRRRRLGCVWLLCCAGNGLLNPALKHLFERVRPVHDAAYATHGVYSFPSGHTSGAVVVYGLVAWLAVRLTTRRWHTVVVAGAAALVFTIAASRVVLQVHWASDVVGGLASGTAWLAVCVLALEQVARPARPPIG